MKPTSAQIKQIQEIRESLARALASVDIGCTSGGDYRLCTPYCANPEQVADSLLRNTSLKDLCLKGELLTDEQIQDVADNYAQYVGGTFSRRIEELWEKQHEAVAKAQHDADSVTIGMVLEEIK